MSDRRHRLFASFNGRHVEIDCGTDRPLRFIAVEPPGQLLQAPVIRPPSASERASRILRGASRFSRPVRGRLSTSTSCISYESGRRPTSPPRIQASSGCTPVPRQRWGVVLLAGPAGAGKSTLVVRLLERGWRLFGDDVVPVDVNRHTALPLPFTPDVRTTPSADLCDQQAFVEQPKQLVTIPPDRVAREPAALARLFFRRTIAHQYARPSLRRCRSYRPPSSWPGRWLIHPRTARGLVADVFRLAQRISLLPSRLPGRDGRRRRVGERDVVRSAVALDGLVGPSSDRSGVVFRRHICAVRIPLSSAVTLAWPAATVVAIGVDRHALETE